MTKIKDITRFLEEIAPLSLQESYDNSGLLTGNNQDLVSGVLLTLDCTEAVVEEAISRNCNLIIAHHPIIFGGLKKINGKNYVERTIIKAIKHDIAIYACHTNLDNVHLGVNKKMAAILGLEDVRILAPKQNTLKKLITYAPTANTNRVISALNDAGAGQIGAYKNCAFRSDGLGQFQPTEEATPTLGTANQLEKVNESRIEVLFPSHLEGQIVTALKNNHPYEEVAYYVLSIENKNQEVGSGMIGTLPTAMNDQAFLKYLKTQFNLEVIRHTGLLNKEVKKIAVCGGAGSFLLQHAINAGADFFITGDFKYHEFFDAENKLVVADIGHYESEVQTKDLFHEILQEKFSNIALNLSEIDTNPIYYYS